MTTRHPLNSPDGARERLRRAGWALDRQVVGPYVYTSGRVLPTSADEGHDGHASSRRAVPHAPPRAVGFLLRLTRDLPLSAVEVAQGEVSASAALVRATEHAEWLGLPFAHALDRDVVLERDLLSGLPREVARVPGPMELWQRVKDRTGITPSVEQCLLKPSYHDVHRPLRYHQIRAVHVAVEAVARGDREVRLVLGAGTGRTYVAFQVCHRLWAAHWNVAGEPRRPRVLYLCDDDDELDAARTGVFASFRHARHALVDGVVENREIYFATPATLLRGAPDPFATDFFDLIVEDRVGDENPALTAALGRFARAARLRLFASPPSVGPALYTYSLRRGVEDGVLAPYRLVEIDRESKKRLTGRKGTLASAAALVRYLEATNPWAKTLVFCRDDEHAARMASCLHDLTAARRAERRDYVGCFTRDAAGRALFDRFRDVGRPSPVLGVATRETPLRGVPTLANVALCAALESESELLAQVGQGVYLRPDHGKRRYDVLDLTGEARGMLSCSSFVAAPDRVASFSPATGGAT